METEVIMQRPLFDGLIGQKSKTGYLCANDILQHGNKWRLLNNLPALSFANWINSTATQDLIRAIEEHSGEKAKYGNVGRSGKTWLHPFLFIDLALAISPKLKVEVYAWITDELLQYRNDSGDSYKMMCGALWEAYPNKREFTAFIPEAARAIKLACGVDKWETATKQQLELRDKMHDTISVVADFTRNPAHAVRIGIDKTLEMQRSKEKRSIK